MVDFSKVLPINPNGVSPYSGTYGQYGQSGTATKPVTTTSPKVDFGSFTFKHRPVGEQLTEVSPFTARANYQNGLAPRAVEKGQTSTVLGFGGNNIECRDIAYA